MKYDEEVWPRLRSRNKASPALSQRQSVHAKRASPQLKKRSAAATAAKKRPERAQLTEAATDRKSDTLFERPLSMRQRVGNATSHLSKNVRERVGRRLIDRRQSVFMVAGALLAIAAVAFIVGGNRQDSDTPRSLGISEGQDSVGTDNIFPIDEPSFMPLFPADFEERDIEVSQRRRNVDEYVTYRDTIGQTPATATQQFAPEDVRGDAGLEQLENLAKSLPVPATDIIVVDDTMVFVGYDSSSARQSVLFLKEGVLFFITAEGQITEQELVAYILQLEQTSSQQ